MKLLLQLFFFFMLIFVTLFWGLFSFVIFFKDDSSILLQLAVLITKLIDFFSEVHEQAILSCDAIHRERRILLKQEIGRMVLFFTDQPSLLAPNIQVSFFWHLEAWKKLCLWHLLLKLLVLFCLYILLIHLYTRTYYYLSFCCFVSLRD